MKYTEKLSNELNNLLLKNYDAEKWYNNAIERVNDKSLKLFFKDKAKEHNGFARELKTELLRYGQGYDDSGTLKGAIERNWLNLKLMMSSNNEEAILEEAIKGEKASLEEYKDLLKDRMLPPSIGALLTKQKAAIQSTIKSEKFREALVS